MIYPFSGDVRFVIGESVASADWDTPKGSYWLALELFDSEQDVRFVHGLKIEIGADYAVGVDDRSTHVGSDFWSVRGLDCGSGDRGGR
jgi:hypothetical protein